MPVHTLPFLRKHPASFNKVNKVKIKILLMVALFAICGRSFAQADLAYWKNGSWSIDFGNNQTADLTHLSGLTGTTRAFVGDYDGDGFHDLIEVDQQGTYCTWYFMINDQNGGWNAPGTGHVFGISANDKVLTGDFNGDGKTDIAVCRDQDLVNSNTINHWYIDFAPVDGIVDKEGYFGLDSDHPVSGDFNADGIDDLAVYRPVANGIAQWFMLTSAGSGPSFGNPLYISELMFGLVNDMPVTGDFNGDGYDDIAVYRSTDNKVYVNLYNQSKPAFAGYGGTDALGTVDLTINGLSAVSNPLAVQAKDINLSRSGTATMPTLTQFSEHVRLRHGWVCLYDNSLNVDKWVQSMQDVGINYLEFHPWMRAHEELVSDASTWNAYAGDERLWTSKSKMKEQVTKFQAVGGKAICYTGIYAATPAFARKYPAWVMRDITSNNLMSYAGDYLYLMSVNPTASHQYTIKGQSFNNFSEFLIDQAVKGQQEYHWDGWRWDWYGYPADYKADALGAATGNFYYEVAGMTDRLKKAVKNVAANSTTTTLQLPTTFNDIPNQQIGTVADYQFLELWPEMGKRYLDLAKHVGDARSRYPDKAVFANFYPQANMSVPQGWPIANINYQYATILSAGGFPSALIVDGVASFTSPVPFHAARYPDANLALISKWNKFVEAYSGYFYFTSPIYSIRKPLASTITATSPSAGFLSKPFERRDKRTGKIDALIVNLINYGSDTTLRWDTTNNSSAITSATVSVTPPAGISIYKAYFITPYKQQQKELTITVSGSVYQVSVDTLDVFGTVVFTTNLTPGMPSVAGLSTTTFTDLPFAYDYRGETLNGNADSITVIADNGILPQNNIFESTVSDWALSNTAYEGSKSVHATNGKTTFTTTSNNAIRIPIDTYKTFEVAVKPDNATATWFGFTLYNPKTNEIKDLYYKVGVDFTTSLPYQLISGTAPDTGWTVHTRNLYNDVIAHPYLGANWDSSIVTRIHLGPLNGSGAYFDAFRFRKPTSLKKSISKSTHAIYPNPVTENGFFIRYTGVKKRQLVVTVSNTNGHLIQQKIVPGNKGEDIHIKWEKKPVPGMYLVQLDNEPAVKIMVF
ncbi:MAG: FG-GAP-like repeat-containing protein [Chitinophagaceae bacterium]